MVLCSGIAENKCTAIPTPQDLFEDYYSCILYGYEYSYKLIAGLIQK